MDFSKWTVHFVVSNRMEKGEQLLMRANEGFHCRENKGRFDPINLQPAASTSGQSGGFLYRSTRIVTKE